MELFRRDYKAAARADLASSVNRVEKLREEEAKKEELERLIREAQANLDFAVRLGLIDFLQREAYRQRLLRAEDDRERLLQAEMKKNDMDGIESSQEQAERYQTMDDYTARIAQARAERAEAEQAANAQQRQAEIEDNERKR